MMERSAAWQLSRGEVGGVLEVMREIAGDGEVRGRRVVIVRLERWRRMLRSRRSSASLVGRVAEAVELELLRAENDRLCEALKEMAIELTLHRGKQRSGFSARSRV